MWTLDLCKLKESHRLQPVKTKVKLNKKHTCSFTHREREKERARARERKRNIERKGREREKAHIGVMKKQNCKEKHTERIYKHSHIRQIKQVK